MFQKLEASILRKISSLSVKVDFLIAEVKKINSSRESNAKNTNADADEISLEAFPADSFQDLERLESKLAEASYRNALVS